MPETQVWSLIQEDSTYCRATKSALSRIHRPLQEAQVQQWRPSTAKKNLIGELFLNQVRKRGGCGTYKRRDYQGESIKNNQSRWEHPSQKTPRVMFPRQTDWRMCSKILRKKKFIAEDEFRVKWLAHRTLRENELLIQRRILSITTTPPPQQKKVDSQV